MEMKLTRSFILCILWLFPATQLLLAQANDCASAITVCDDPNFYGNPSGKGLDDFADPDNKPGCLVTENNTIWLYFEMDASTPPGIELGMIINPSGGAGEDYDWAIYGPNVNCGNLGSPKRCSSSSDQCGFCPQTGMGMGAQDLSEGPGTGDGFVKTLNVNAGEGYFIVIDNFKGTNMGFTLDFTEAGAEYVDCAAIPPCFVDVAAHNDTAVCQGVDPFKLYADAVTGGSLPINYSWTGSGGGTAYLDDPNVQNPTVILPPNFNGKITFTVTATNGTCEDMDDIVVTVNPKPNVNIQPVPKLCTNQPPYQLIGTPASGIWGGIANSSGKVDPGQQSPGVYEATLTATNGFGCTGKDTVSIEIVEPTEITLDPPAALCIEAPAIQLVPTPPGGVWSGSIDAMGKFDPGTYGVGTHVVTYTFTNAAGCKSTKNIDVVVLDKPNVVIVDPGTLCAKDSVVNIDANPGGGNWSGAVDASGNIYPKKLGPGSYTVIYNYTNGDGCSNVDSISVKIANAPTASLKTPVTICNQNNLGKNTIVDFSTLILSGDNSGTWTDNNGSGATGNFPVLDFKNSIPGTYPFTYTVNAGNGSCPPFTKTIEIIVENCLCPSIAIGSPGAYCINSGNVNLATYTITTEPGTWSIQSAPPGSNPATISGNQFTGTNKDAGTYTLVYTLNTAPPPGCPASTTTTLNLISPPNAVVVSTATLCNKVGGGSFPNTINLYDLVTGGDQTGSWLDIDGSGASGPNTNLDFTGIAPGKYNFSYTTNSAVAPCMNASYSVQLTVLDCSCPPIVLSNPPALCNSNGTLDLLTVSQGSASGSWTITNTPGGGNTASIQFNVFDVIGSASGVYTLTYSLTTPVAGCPNKSSVDINVYAPPTALLPTFATICNSPGSTGNPTSINVTSLITGGDLSGTWSDLESSGAPVSGTTYNFNGIPPGTYTFKYTTATATPPCMNTSYLLDVIVKDCSCPDVSILPTKVYCTDQSLVDLQALVITTEAGQWTVTSIPPGSNPANISGSNLNIQGHDPGIYQLTFTLLTPPPAGCASTSTCQVTLEKAPDAGIANAIPSICPGNNTIIQLANYLTGADVGGSWTLATGSAPPGTAFNPTGATLNTVTLSPGKYSFEYQLKGKSPCKDASNVVSVDVLTAPSVSTGPDITLDCTQSSTTLDPVVNPPTNIAVQWQGPGITDPTLLSQTVQNAGTYIIQVTDTKSNCTGSDTLEIQITGNPITDATPDLMDTPCPQAKTGSIHILDVTGGTEPYTYSIDGGAFVSENLFTNLTAGNYTITIKDINGCVYDVPAQIQAGSGITLDLGPDITIEQGKTYSIQSLINVPDTSLAFITWTPAVCSNCLSFTETATSDITYQLQLTDKAGCTTEDQVSVFVQIFRYVYTPNVISGNNDGINDGFTIFGQGIKNVSSLKIFNRWGDLLWEGKDLPPNNPGTGWQAQSSGRAVNPGVYVYAAELLFEDGKTILFKGDVTVVK